MESVCALLGIEKMLRDAIHGDRSKLDILGHVCILCDPVEYKKMSILTVIDCFSWYNNLDCL